LYRYQRHPLLLVQVNPDNHRIRIFYLYTHYTSNHGQQCFMLNCLFLFIPATDSYDTKTLFDGQAANLLIVNICSIVGSMRHTSHDRNKK
jgi:hypothetical protein